MAPELDRTQQRIIGVLLEKELAVPESYPLTEKALIAACNQKSNRDPEMALEQFEVNGAMNALMTADWAKTTTSTGGHATRYAHRLDSQLAVADPEKAILCELLVRGPQAPGALKSRVARLGFQTNPTEIEALLRDLAARPRPMVEQLPKRPRERDHRWRHLLGPMNPAHEADGAAAPVAGPPSVAQPVSAAAAASATHGGLEERVDQLENEVAELRAELAKLRDR
jgi:uncharacterized protein